MIDIAISGLVKEFEVGKKILDGLTFQVDSGERVGLLGKNGCGKTTLLRILTGQLDWDEGEIHIAPGKGLGLISQIPVYPDGYTVEDVLRCAFRELRNIQKKMEQLEQQMVEQAKKRIETRLVLEAIAKAEDIQVSDEELDKEIEEMAKAYQMEADQLKKYLGEAEAAQMKTDIAVQKAVDLLCAEAVEV